jgi:uncharacterized RDD family membrane protein YckC
MEVATAPSIFEQLENEQPRFEYATTGQRFANYIVDMLVFYGFNYGIFFILGFALSFFSATNGLYDLLSNKLALYGISMFNLIFIYTCIEGFSKGNSLGKLITGTKAVQEDHSPITWKQAITRSLCRIIPFEAFSGLGGYPWHDSMTGTRVIKKMQTAL